MAKRNRSRIKKRRKRQLQKRISSTTKVVPAVAVREIPPITLYLGKYAAENAEYQKTLDSIYEGKVRPYGKYINPNATLRHFCTGCNKGFYGRPSLLLGSRLHVCGAMYEGNKTRSAAKSKGEDLDWNEFYEMVWNDYDYQTIAQKFQINRNIVKLYFETNGLI